MLNAFNKVKARCADGVERTFHQTGEADTFFSIPGFVYVTHRNDGVKRCARVYGFLSKDTEADGETEIILFTAVKYRKNYALIVDKRAAA